MEISNKLAYHNYFVLEEIECGIALRGNEVKSIRSGMASIKQAWCSAKNGQLLLIGMHITKWGTANEFDVDENRERVLLAHKREIRNLESAVSKDGVTLVPLKVYFKKGRCKVLIGVCKGKHLYDKRNSLKNAEIQKDMLRAMKESGKRTY